MAAKPAKPLHVVVDGSNIATEGRSNPSLAQLNDAVLAFLEEHPGALVTVVVDATFGHRIDPSEVTEFDKAVANNELVAPPAGAVGRGDAFVLGIANKAGALILSNDSFQEFHGLYPWLFEPGRLVGGKPVPHVGWVFVERTPVRGPVSRKAVRQKRNGDASLPGSRRRASKAASEPMPVPPAPPPGARPAGKAAEKSAARAGEQAVEGRKHASPSPPSPPSPSAAIAAEAKAQPKAGSFVNELLPFLSFVEQHPVGSSVNAVVESYSSHGAYVAVGDVRGYVPLRLMSDPPPRSAREVMRVGDAITLVVHSFAPARRSIDLAQPHVAAAMPPVVEPVAVTPAEAEPERLRRKKAAAAAEAGVQPAAKPQAGHAVKPAAAATAKKPAEKPATNKPTGVGARPAPTPVVEKPPTAPARAPKPVTAKAAPAKAAAKVTKATKAAKAAPAKATKAAKVTKATKAAKAAPAKAPKAAKAAPAKAAPAKAPKSAAPRSSPSRPAAEAATKPARPRKAARGGTP
jgi:hypothetical protein